MHNFSLYVNHQSIAPLIRQLQTIVQIAQSQVGQTYQKHQIRMTIYHEFIRQIHDMYARTHPEVKLQDIQVKIQDILNIKGHREIERNIQNFDNTSQIQTRGRKSRAGIAKNLEIEVKLVQWLISCDKILFQKREIDQKYQELLQNKKKTLTLNKIKEIVQKYKINALIIKTRGGQQHFFTKEAQNTESTIIKKQEQQSLNIEKWIQDEQQTINPSKISKLQQIKHQHNTNQSSQILNVASLKEEKEEQTRLKMLNEQSSNDQLFVQFNKQSD